MMGDTLARRLGQPAFSWGNSHRLDDNAMRLSYMAALRAADRHDVGRLLIFARS